MERKSTNRPYTDRMLDDSLIPCKPHNPLLKSLFLTKTQFKILKTLAVWGMLRMGEMSNILSISRPNLTPSVDKLVELQYIERKADAKDRRVVFTAITAQGREAFLLEQDIIDEMFAPSLKEEGID